MATEIQDLFPEARNSPELRAINDRCQIRTQEGHRVVIVSGIPVAHYAVADRMAEAHAMVNLVEQGWADQNDVARAFGYSARTLRRDQRRYEEGGLAALGQPRGYPAGRARWRDSRRQTVHRLKTQGHSNCEIARRLGISETAVRKVLIRMGWKEHHEQTEMLPLDAKADSNPKLSAFCVAAPPAPASQDTDPSDRSADRLLARLGLLEDAPPLFGSASAVPRAGVLLALPVLIASGVFDCARKSTAVSARASMDCAPVCSRCC
jgi:transposase